MTEFNIKNKNRIICLWEPDQVKFWTKKWRITSEQLNDAILQTGSIHVEKIENYLMKNGRVFSLSRLSNYLKKMVLKVSWK